MLVFGVELFHVFSPHLLQRSIFTSLSSSFSFPFHFLSSLLLLSPSPSSFLALFAPADNEIPAADRDAGKENIFWRGKLSRTRRRKHKQTQLGRRGKGRNLRTAKYIIKRSTSSFFSSVPENVSDLRFLLVWSAEIPGYTILDKVHFTIVAHK